MRVATVAAAVFALSGCNGSLVINCMDDQLCVRAGAQGHCVGSTASSSKFCAFSDGTCAGGERWDPTAGDSLGGTCVGGGPLGDGGMTNSDMHGGNGDMGNLGGWQKRLSGDGTTPWLFGVWGSSSKDIYAVGQLTKAVLHSTDSGMTWPKESLPDPNGDEPSFYAVWGNSATDVYIAGESGYVMHSDGTGLNWKLVNVPTSNDLNAMWGTAGEIWAVGDTGTVLHNVAGAWTLQTTPMGCQESLHGIFGIDNKHLWTVGYNGVFCGTVDGGANWLALNNTGDTKSLGGIWGQPPLGGLLVIAAEQGFVYRSTSGGNTWKVDTTPTTNDFFGIFGNSANDIYAIGGNPTSDIIHWDGTKWNEQVSPINEGLNAIWASGPTDYYIVGYDQTILHGP